MIPETTGDIDANFVKGVLEGYIKVCKGLEREIIVVYHSEHPLCIGSMQIFFTDFARLHVRPYFDIEQDVNRKARTLVRNCCFPQLQNSYRYH